MSTTNFTVFSLKRTTSLNSSSDLSLPLPLRYQLQVLDEILTYPEPMNTLKLKKVKSTSDVPKHLSGEHYDMIFRGRLERERLEEEKVKQQEEREKNRKNVKKKRRKRKKKEN